MNRIHTLTLGRIVKTVGILAASIGLLWYIGFQARSLIAGPSIVLADTAVPQDTRVVTVEGTAHNIISLLLDDRPIFTDDDGNFREQVVLENGYTIATLRARDRYGREQVLRRAFVYTPAYEPLGHD